ncbi:hypothetical protein [Rhizorhabdus sp. FW153]|uniref:hypothetical protein n=1 Tax=Rhizorhabdus sp. FW153 TaxID=3400216 RepID=UPI003CE7D60E
MDAALQTKLCRAAFRRLGRALADLSQVEPIGGPPRSAFAELLEKAQKPHAR